MIIGAILIAAVYAVISFWPAESIPPQPPVNTEIERKERAPETSSDRRQIEAEVLTNLIKIGSAELSFHSLRKRWGTFQELVRDNLLNAKFSEGAIIHGYQYSLVAGGEHFACYADPDGELGRHYFIDKTLDIRYDDNGRASSSSLYLSDAQNQPSKSEIGTDDAERK